METVIRSLQQRNKNGRKSKMLEEEILTLQNVWVIPAGIKKRLAQGQTE